MRRSPRSPGREAVAGSVEEAERLLAQLGGGAPESDLQTYDVGHARAVALMRRGRFVDSYAPAIAAGEAIARAGRPDLAYGCWANAAGAATAVGEQERALEFIDRGLRAIDERGLQSLEIHLLAARAFVLTRLHRLEDARTATCPRNGSPSSSGSRSCSRWSATIAGSSRSRPASTAGRPAARSRARRGRADQPPAHPPGARRGARPCR